MIDRDDPEAWSLYKNGLTKGIFQLESNHGRNWSKKLAPENIEELSALIALLRPGCTKSIIDGKSMTQRFVDRKHKTVSAQIGFGTAPAEPTGQGRQLRDDIKNK